MNIDLRAELKVDHAAFVADGSQLWWFLGGTQLRRITSLDDYVQVIVALMSNGK